MLNSVLVPLVLLLNGLAAGVLVGAQLGGFPLMVDLPPGQYVHAHAFFATRYDPFMPACLLGTVLGDLVLAFAPAEGAVRALHVIGAVFAALTVVVSVTKNVPINRWVRSLDPENLPADFERLDRRHEWGAWNARRGGLAVLALLVNCVAAGLLI
ncbi:MAG TPA: DUF1772 domain-containing protein [Pseudonocardiaceae bacterium]|nr:DUF1772 domain-containing protein [Pseudonocardiaceae bacterium]